MEGGTREYPFFSKGKIREVVKAGSKERKPTWRRPMHVERGRL